MYREMWFVDEDYTHPKIVSEKPLIFVLNV